MYFRALLILAMTLAELKTRLNQHLAADLDNYAGDTPSDDELEGQINFAIRAIGRAIFMVKPVLVTVASGTSIVELDRQATPIVQVFRVTVDGLYLMDYRDKPGLMNFAEMEAEAEGWQLATKTGIPSRAIQLDRRLYLWPKPTSEEAIVLTAQVLPQALVLDTDVPDLPLWVHEAIVTVAATYAADPHATEEEGLARLGRFDKRTMEMITGEGERNRELYAGTSGRRRSAEVQQ